MENDLFRLQGFKNELCVSRIATLQYFEFAELYQTKAASHSFRELLYVDRGTINVSAEGYTGALKVNQAIIHRPDEIHSLSIGEKISPNVIIIGFECDCPALDPLSRSPATLTQEQIRLLARVLTEGMSVFEPPYDVADQRYMKKRDDPPFGADQMLKMTLESFLISLVRSLDPPRIKSGRSDSALSAVKRYLDENYTARITLDNLCFLFGTNKTTLCRNFKEEYDKTVTEYVTERRLDEAKALLRDGSSTVTQISQQLGFDSVHYFSRTFKKRVGISPSEYRGKRDNASEWSEKDKTDKEEDKQ